MAQLVLSAASSAAAAIGNAGIGAAIARTAASTAASFVAGRVDRLIFGPQKRTVEGPRLESFTVQASTEGAGILRVYGRARVAGQLIWAANFKEMTAETTESAGGKGGRSATQTNFTEYLYSISFAVGLCEGVINRIGRVWADGKPLDLSKINYRLYRGTDDQTPDDLINSVEGGAPAYRGLAYIVFEDLPLKDFGNRIPQLAFEVEKRLAQDDDGALENAVAAVTMIPGTGEFVYGTTKVVREAGEGVTLSENVNNNSGETNFVASLDAAQSTLPNLKSASLVVSWFGDSLDAGACQLRPGVETVDKTTAPYAWSAGGVDRGGARLISRLNDAPAFGGTPADRAVIEGVEAMKAAGLKVMFHPFILMDIPGSYPWRGRIGAGGVDGTPAATSAVAAFFGAAQPSHFSVQNGAIVYAGPAEWSFRRMILHYAHLCALAGGVDTFLLGSELRALTTMRDGAGGYPAVAAMRALAADVRSVLGPQTAISYGADWSEYFGHQLADGPSDVIFHLDDFWSDPAVDFVGVDNYVPLADWRDGFAHTDALAGAAGPYDPAYLSANVEGGEGYDWFYANAADRDAQLRTPITDGAYDEPWIYRYKDFKNWWSQPHYNRIGGVRASASTGWIPQSKPIRFTEAGCPAVDKGANQPNVFVDEKSSESALPYFSTGARDDLAQRRYIEALLGYWRDPANNPISSVYGGPMIDVDAAHIYAWDARPFPFFPARRDIWGDSANWEKGHWLNGRAGRAPLSLLIDALAGAHAPVEAGGLKGVITGYVIDRPMSPREMIDPLANVFQFDMIEAGAVIRFQPRDAEPVATIARSALADASDALFSVTLAQEADLPVAFRLGFIDEGADFSPAVAEARDPGCAADASGAIRFCPAREGGAEIAGVIPQAEAEARARSILADAWVMRERAVFSLPPSRAALEPGDAVEFETDGAQRRYRITDVTDAGVREIEAVRVSPSVYEAPVGALAVKAPPTLPVYGAPIWTLMDLPLLRDDDDPAAPTFAAFADPWPGAAALYRDPGGGTPVAAGRASVAAVMGRLDAPLPSAPSGRWINQSVTVSLTSGGLASRSVEDIFAGANLMAVQSASGAFEVFQFRDATLVEPGQWRLSHLLRGQAGTDAEALAGAAAGARTVLLTRALSQPAFNADLRGASFTWSAGPEGDAPGTETYTEKNLVLTARGLRPLSPVHLRARPDNGGFALQWIRRTRIGGDSWESEAPLGEVTERYQVTIYDGAAPVRTVETTAPRYAYAAADAAADFGAAPASLAFGVRQWSDRVGWGDEARLTAASP
ncbi:MAG: glycoside hydrolase/phage tail family protein [Pseudomonadota bacterium]